MKVAILSPAKIEGNFSGLHVLGDIAVLLNSDGRTKVTIFSVDKKEEKISKHNYSEEVVKGVRYIKNKDILLGFLEYLSIFLFKRSYLYQVRNNNKRFFKALSKFSPSIIITSYEFSDLVKRYKDDHDEVKILALMDDPRQIEDTVNAKILSISDISRTYIIYKYLANIVGQHYINIINLKYSKLVSYADRVINFTEEGMSISKTLYKKYSYKFHVIPPPLKVKNTSRNLKTPILHNKPNILFLGSCGYSPNDEAINLIVNKIAPKTKNFKFILVGTNCKSYTANNVISKGYVSNLDEVLNEVSICIAPIIHGGGIKTKVLSYFLANKPVIGTSKAFEGYPIRNGTNAIIEDDINNYPKQIIKLYQNQKIRKRLIKNSYSVCSYFSPRRIKKFWLELFSSI